MQYLYQQYTLFFTFTITKMHFPARDFADAFSGISFFMPVHFYACISICTRSFMSTYIYARDFAAIISSRMTSSVVFIPSLAMRETVAIVFSMSDITIPSPGSKLFLAFACS